MQLNDLLTAEGIDPKTVLVMRHVPAERELRKVLPWLAAERPDTFNEYQRMQLPRAEKATTKAAYVASFLGDQPGKALFVGLYKVAGWKPVMTEREYLNRPKTQELLSLGMHYRKGRGFTGKGWQPVLLFDLALTDFYALYKGKLIISWPGLERAWYRWADRKANVFSVHAILEDSALDAEMPAWKELTLTWNELDVLPSKWKAALRQWRGVYLIFDTSDQKGYVGSAYGTDNILGRWLNYAKTGHGGTKMLRRRDPKNFRFSILQRVSPDMDADDVIRLEGTWKDRLHTREFGLNEN